ncbi:MAG: hypothetical protein QXH85_05680 [Candidatus Bathyarchaeia archaeon]
MSRELAYNRDAIRKRFKRHILAIESWRNDLIELIGLLLMSGYEEKAKNWGLLLNSLDVVMDLWLKLIEDL